MPGAFSFPLFNDGERAIIGTVYKQESKAAAVKIGLDFFGPKMRKMVEEVEKLTSVHGAPYETTVLLYCWRGGMRSDGVAWLLDLYGFKVYKLQGGYKTFRHWVLNQFEKSYALRLVGGNTGSGKTYLLHELMKQGQKVIDLEGLASHKGSAFGNIGMPDQPSQEMFENKLALELHYMNASNQIIWLEDESQRIGTVNIPLSLWQTMLLSPVYFLDIPFDERLNFIEKEYGQLDKERLVNAIIRIKKRLGGLETKNAIHFLIENNVRESFRILLKYYDKSYQKSLHKKENLSALLTIIPCEKVDPITNASKMVSDKDFSKQSLDTK
jgi:tRNA 2-selenouridine synthase